MTRTAPLLSLLLAGCVIGSEKYPRPRDLSPTWLVDRTRVLAIAAEPPEIRPGERATFSALLAGPDLDADPLVQVWFACPVDDEGNGFGCVPDLGALDLDSDPEALFDAGFIGTVPGLPPTYTAPGDLLAGLDEAARAEGRYVNTQVTAVPERLLTGLGEATGTATLPDVDFQDIEVAYKRLVVSEALTPNHNPTLEAFLVDRVEIAPGAVVEVDAGQRYDLGLRLPDGAREVYVFVNGDGEAEERVEEPYAAWYSTGGEVLEEVTLHPYLESTWEAPADAGEEGTWFVVLRDRRGGMVWHTQGWRVR